MEKKSCLIFVQTKVQVTDLLWTTHSNKLKSQFGIVGRVLDHFEQLGLVSLIEDRHVVQEL